jgi:hypothetical protein
MSTAVEAPQVAVAVPAAAPVRVVRPWVLGPWLDLFFLANISWPLIVLVALGGAAVSSWNGSPVVQSLTFWQIYFLSTPHRWITLALVFLDEDKFQQRPRAFVGLAGFFGIVAIAAFVLGTGLEFFLVAVDYFWNAWHFAAQHSGISRIYARAARPEEQTSGLWEKVLLRTFVMYVIFRAGAAACVPMCNDVGRNVNDPSPIAGHISSLFFADGAFLRPQVDAFNALAEGWLDVLFLIPPLLLLGGEVLRFRASAMGRLAYLGSVIAAYTTALFAIHYHHVVLAFAVLLSIALFHATEYLAIVSWAVLRKPPRERKGAFAYLAPRWTLSLVLFMVVLGVSGWALSLHLQREWAVLTLAVSFLHYAYDGMIWKARRAKPATA